MLLTKTSNANATANPGSNGGRGPSATPPWPARREASGLAFLTFDKAGEDWKAKFAKGKSTDAKAAMLAAGCTYRDVKPLPPQKDKTNFHADFPTLSSPTAGLWSTSPPSAGSHYGAWAVWGFYRAPVNPRQVVHNEEHGGVIIWWGPKFPKSTVDQLEGFYNQKPDGMLGTPYASLGNKIALTAWTALPGSYYAKGNYGIGHIAVCSKFDQKAFAAFRSAYRGKGPEGVPLSADEPGMGPQ